MRVFQQPASYYLLIPLLLLSGCATTRYYMQSAGGQIDILQRSEPIDALLLDEQVDDSLRMRLQRVQAIRRFATDELGLPASESYTRYADIERDAVVWNLFVAPEFSVTLHTWCYPVAGCAAYRGYFDTDMLQADRDRYRQQGYDTWIGGVPAYSTLGWFADPVLSTVIDWPETRLAGLIFHEMAHEQLYVQDDTVFNESFATAVQQAGVERWLQAQGREEEILEYRRWLEARRQVVGLIGETRQLLGQLYDTDIPEDSMRARKAQLLDAVRTKYRQLRESLQLDPGYDRWFAGEINNAKLGSVVSYHTYVADFLALFEDQGGDFERFYSAVERIVDMPEEQRRQCLQSEVCVQPGLMHRDTP